MDPIAALKDLATPPGPLEETAPPGLLEKGNRLVTSAASLRADDPRWEEVYRSASGVAHALVAEATRRVAELHLTIQRLQQVETAARRPELPSAALEGLIRKLDGELREAYDQGRRRIETYTQIFREQIPKQIYMESDGNRSTRVELESRKDSVTFRLEPSDEGWVRYCQWLEASRDRLVDLAREKIRVDEYQQRFDAWILEVRSTTGVDISDCVPHQDDQPEPVRVDPGMLERPCHELDYPSFSAPQWTRIVGLAAPALFGGIATLVGSQDGESGGGLNLGVSAGAAGLVLAMGVAGFNYRYRAKPRFVARQTVVGSRKVATALSELADKTLAKQADFLRIWLESEHRSARTFVRNIVEGVRGSAGSDWYWPPLRERARPLDATSTERAVQAAEQALMERLTLQQQLQQLERARNAYASSVLDPLRRRARLAAG